MTDEWKAAENVVSAYEADLGPAVVSVMMAAAPYATSVLSLPGMARLCVAATLCLDTSFLVKSILDCAVRLCDTSLRINGQDLSDVGTALATVELCHLNCVLTVVDKDIRTSPCSVVRLLLTHYPACISDVLVPLVNDGLRLASAPHNGDPQDIMLLAACLLVAAKLGTERTCPLIADTNVYVNVSVPRELDRRTLLAAASLGVRHVRCDPGRVNCPVVEVSSDACRMLYNCSCDHRALVFADVSSGPYLPDGTIRARLCVSNPHGTCHVQPFLLFRFLKDNINMVNNLHRSALRASRQENREKRERTSAGTAVRVATASIRPPRTDRIQTALNTPMLKTLFMPLETADGPVIVVPKPTTAGHSLCIPCCSDWIDNASGLSMCVFETQEERPCLMYTTIQSLLKAAIGRIHVCCRASDVAGWRRAVDGAGGGTRVKVDDYRRPDIEPNVDTLVYDFPSRTTRVFKVPKHVRRLVVTRIGPTSTMRSFLRRAVRACGFGPLVDAVGLIPVVSGAAGDSASDSGCHAAATFGAYGAIVPLFCTPRRQFTRYSGSGPSEDVLPCGDSADEWSEIGCACADVGTARCPAVKEDIVAFSYGAASCI